MQMHKGWFAIPGVQFGDRTIEQQLLGLDSLLAEVAGRSVLDFGCAEGLIAAALVAAGAKSVDGVDSVAASIEMADRLHPDPRLHFYHCDLNAIDETALDEATPVMVDVSLALALLHKLQQPLLFARYLAKITRELIVIRLPASTPGFVQDARTKMVRFDVSGELGRCGYRLDRVTSGHDKEWIGFYRRQP